MKARKDNLEFLRSMVDTSKEENLAHIKNHAIDTASEGILLSDLEGKAIYANPAFLKIWSLKSYENLNLKQCFSEDKAENIIESIITAGSWDSDLVKMLDDGRKIYLHNVANIVVDQAGKPISIMLLCVDITEQKKTEEKLQEIESQLQQSAKLASLGEMATGVAHELNNPLAAIEGYAQLIKKNSQSESLTEQIDRILKSSERMKKIVQHLKIFGRDSGKDAWSSVCVSTPIKDSFILLEGQLKADNIKYELDLEDNLPQTLGDHNQLESVFQNLIVNSRDAFNDQKNNDSRSIKIKSFLADSETIEIHYEDNAGGMPESVLKKLFEPFFTTKAEGFGTGLGMSILYGIIKEHDGNIDVKSTLGIGTRFNITLPVVKIQKEKKVSKISAKKNILPKNKSKQRVLIIDDEEDLCEILALYLSDDFHVDFTSEIVESFRLLEGQVYDLVITDWNMPDMNGSQLIEEVSIKYPEIKFIVSSGLVVEKEELAKVKHKTKITYLPKPYGSPENLVSFVRDFLA